MVTAVTGTTWSNKGGTSSTAELRALGAQFNAALVAAGMVQTADTGQVNWTTITWVSGAQTWGYEVWRFNDTLQATKPVFLRLTYSQPSGNMLHLVAQVGTATDGAGNLTSAAGTGVSVTAGTVCCFSGGSTVAATVGSWYVYGDGSAIAIAIHPDRMNASSTGYGGLFFLERVRHTDGSALGDAVTCCWATGIGASVTTQVVLLSNLYAQPASWTYGWFPGQPTGMFSSGVIGTSMFTFPWFTGLSPRLGAPSTMVIGHYRTDMSPGNVFTCDHYGAPRTFVALAPSGSGYAFGMGGGTGITPAIRIF